MNIGEFNKLPARFRALISAAVLLDGVDGSKYLANDLEYGEKLRILTDSFAGDSPENRLPLAGTLFRQATSELKEKEEK